MNDVCLQEKVLISLSLSLSHTHTHTHHFMNKGVYHTFITFCFSRENVEAKTLIIINTIIVFIISNPNTIKFLVPIYGYVE